MHARRVWSGRVLATAGACALAVVLTALTARAESVELAPVPLAIPAVDRVEASLPVGDGVAVDVRLRYDDRGRFAADGAATVGGQEVLVSGRVRVRRGVPSITLLARGDDGTKLTLRAALDGAGVAAVAAVRYRGPAGRLAADVPVTLTTRDVAWPLGLDAAADGRGRLTGPAVLGPGYRDLVETALRAARLRGPRLAFSARAGRDRVRFRGVLAPGDAFAGTLRYTHLPDRGAIAYSVPVAALLPPPRVTGVTMPSGASGDIELTITYETGAADEVHLRVAVSADGGASWRDAGIADAPDDPDDRHPADPSGTTRLVWQSLPDIGFHDEVTAILRVRAEDANGYGTTSFEVLPPIDNLRAAAARVDLHAVHYGPLDADTIALLEPYDLVVVHPRAAAVTRQQVAELQDGVDPSDPGDDVIVLAYISAGEDGRTYGLTPEEMLLDPRFVGDGSGPRVDPRGAAAGGTSLVGLPPLGDASPGGGGFASYYLDDNDRDGRPDFNPSFLSAFVNAGDPAWFAVLQEQTSAVEGAPGLREILTDEVGRGLRCDGVFLDTYDTAAPNAFTSESSEFLTRFEWTAAGFRDFAWRLRNAHPRTLVLQNRGLFYFDPSFPHFSVTTRDAIDFVLFESYRLDNHPGEPINEHFYADNRYNLTPRLAAEMNRPGAFRVLSLGYAEGPPDAISQDTLLGLDVLGRESFLTDVEVTHEVGFRHYLTNRLLTLANRFVLEEASFEDDQPPVWSSTYNANAREWPEVHGAPDPRVGIQQARGAPGGVVVRWDVALDLHRVGYAVYYQEQPFDFEAPDPLVGAVRGVLSSERRGTGYAAGAGPDVFAHEDVVTGLTAGKTYHFLVRAFDAAPLRNEDANTVTLSATPTDDTWLTAGIDGDLSEWAAAPVLFVDAADAPASSGPDWTVAHAANDASNVYLAYQSDDPFVLGGSALVFIDVDGDAATGYSNPSLGVVGSDLLAFADGLYRQETSFNDGFLEPLAYAVAPDGRSAELAIPLSQVFAIAPAATELRITMVNDATGDVAPDSGGAPYRLAVR